MGKRDRRRGLEDVAEVAADALRSLADTETAQRRRQEREERRRRSEQRQRRDLLATGAGLLAGGLAASLGLITVAAVGMGLLVGGIVVYGLKAADEHAHRRRLAPAAPRPALIDPDVAPDAPRAALVRSVVASAMGSMRTVDRAAQRIGDVEIAALLTRIAMIGSRMCSRVAETPAGFDAAQRALTYHAEKAAQLAEMAVATEATGDGQRLSSIRKVLGRMELLFEETDTALRDGDRREMDLELRLIDQALDEDLSRRH